MQPSPPSAPPAAAPTPLSFLSAVSTLVRLRDMADRPGRATVPRPASKQAFFFPSPAAFAAVASSSTSYVSSHPVHCHREAAAAAASQKKSDAMKSNTAAGAMSAPSPNGLRCRVATDMDPLMAAASSFLFPVVSRACNPSRGNWANFAHWRRCSLAKCRHEDARWR